MASYIVIKNTVILSERGTKFLLEQGNIIVRTQIEPSFYTIEVGPGESFEIKSEVFDSLEYEGYLEYLD